MNVIKKNDIIMTKISDFFVNNNNIDYLINILNNNIPISLRIIDWFVTNYSKKNNTEYPLKRKMTSPKRTTLKKIHGKTSKKDDSRNNSNNYVKNSIIGIYH